MTPPPAEPDDSGAGTPPQPDEAPNQDAPKKASADKFAVWSVRGGWIVTIVVAVAANLTTIVIAHTGQTNASIQSAKEFRRGQQQTQYIDFINAASAFSDAAIKYQGAVASFVVARKIDDNAVEPLRQDAETRLHTLNTKLGGIRLVGSPETVSASIAVANSGTNSYNHSTRQAQKLKNAEPVDAPTLEFSDKLAASINRFADTARRDVEATTRP